MASSIDCCSTKDLWNKLSATVLRIPSEEVDDELNNAKSQFQNGLLYYKSNMSKSTGDPHKDNDKNLDTLVSKIADMLNLEKNLALKIFENYLMYEYRGAGKSIEDYLVDPQLRKRLMMDIWLSYLREQVFLLHCMKLVWMYRKDLDHPYQDNFIVFLGTIDKDDLLENLILQAEILVKERPPKRTDSDVVTQTLIEEWISYNMWCQILTAQLILELTHTHPVTPKDVERLFVIYKQQNFGWNPGFQHALTENHRGLPKMLTACHISVLVHIIMQVPSLEEGVLVNGRDMIVKLKEHIDMLDTQDNHGLLMMAYNVAFFYEKEDNSNDIALIEKAMKVNQFPVLYSTLQAVKLMNDDPIEGRIFQVMMNLLTKLLNNYYINTFCNFPMFYEVASLLLSNSECNKSFLENPDSSLHELVSIASEYFPYFKPPLLLLVTGFAKANSNGLKKALSVLEKLDIFTEEIPLQAIDVVRKGEHLMLNTDRLLLDGTLKIPAKTIGVTSQVSTPNPLVHWHTRYNFWDVVCAEQKSIVATIRSGHSDDLGHSAIVLECIYAVLDAGWHGDKKMTSAIQEVFELVECFCKMPKPPLELLGIAMKIFTVLAEKHCENVCNSASSIKLIPFCRLLPNYEPSLTSPVDYGIFDYTLNQFECDEGKSQFIQAYIKFILEIIKHPEVPSGTVVAGIIAVNECIFPGHARWQYSIIGDSDELGLLCLKLFHTLLTPLTETSKSLIWQKLCLESLLMSKASPMLLDIATTGERYIETLMVEQSTFMSGRIISLLKKVQLSLSVLNLVLQKKHLLLNNSFDCYLLQQISTSRQIQKNNFYFRLTSYLYSRFHPFLPTLAMKVLQKIFEVIPISLRAYMAIEDNSIRQTFEIRLISEDDYPPLRTAIIDTIATCVKTGTQSALIEVLFTVENTPRKSLKTTSDKNLKPSSEESPVLQFLLGVILNTKNNPYKVSNGIYLSVINLVNTCWEKQKDYLRTKIGTSSDFWENLFAPLKSSILASPIYPTLFRIICLELLTDKDNKQLCDELRSFIYDYCIMWNAFVLKKMKKCVSKEVATEDKAIIQSWSTFLVMILKKKLDLVQNVVLVTLNKEYLDALMDCLNTNFEGPCVNLIAQILLHLIIAGKTCDHGTNFTHAMSRLLMVLSQKYVYIPTDSRTLIMAIVNTGMSCNSFSIDEVCQGESTFILSLSEIILNEVLYVPALTKGHRGSPMLYCCVFQFLKLAYASKNATHQSLERIGSTNTLASVMRNATKLIKGREDAMCAEVAMNVLVAASQIPALVHYLIIGELPDLFQALTFCKERVTEKQEIEWDGVYSQGVILSSNLINEAWIMSEPSVMSFVVDHRLHLTSFLMFLRRRQDRHALLMAMQIGTLLSKVCESKSTWHYTHGESLKELTNALQVCVDLCILFLTRPKISLGVQHIIPFPYVEFKHPSEKNDLLMKIAGKCLECLSKITSPEMTILQEYIQLADDRRQIQVVGDTLKPGPSLARDYQPSLSFGHLNELSNQCIQVLFEPRKRNKDSSSTNVYEVHRGITKATLDRCLLFTMQQAKAHMQRVRDPCAIAQFRRDIYYELEMVLNNVKFKLNKKTKRAGSLGECNIGDVTKGSYTSQSRPRLIFPPSTGKESTNTPSTSGQQSSRLTKGFSTEESYIAPYTTASANTSFPM